MLSSADVHTQLKCDSNQQQQEDKCKIKIGQIHNEICTHFGSTGQI